MRFRRVEAAGRDRAPGDDPGAAGAVGGSSRSPATPPDTVGPAPGEPPAAPAPSELPAAPTPGALAFSARLHQLGQDRAGAPALWFVPVEGEVTVLSWDELDARSTQVARWLSGRGLDQAQRVALALHNTPELVLSVLAAYQLGAVPVPMRWDLPEWERRRVLACLDPALVVTEDDLEAIRATGSLSTNPLPEAVSPESWGICSSGSTGSPKVIVRAVPGFYDPAVPVAAMVDAYRPLPRPQRIAVPAPLYHTNGFTAVTNLLGGEQVVLFERFQPDPFLSQVAALGVTGFIAATPLLQRMARSPEWQTVSLPPGLWVQQGAAPIPDWLARCWIDRVGAEQMFFSYGSTEAIGIVGCRGDEWLAHPGTVGRGTGGAEVRILDDEGRPVPTGEVGMIYLRSPTGGVHRYLGDVPPVPRTDDGFATVGDLGWLDDDGYLYVADRRDDLIVSGGVNVHPAEVEAALSEHPAIADVVVVGLADPEWGRRVHAIVEPRPGSELGPEEVVAFARSRLSGPKVPKSVELVDRLPRTEAGKLNRSALAAVRAADEGRPADPDPGRIPAPHRPRSPEVP
jgi:bile acid-coenzyme A ligase